MKHTEIIKDTTKDESIESPSFITNSNLLVDNNNNNNNNCNPIILNHNLYDLRRIFLKNVPLNLNNDDISLLISTLTKQKPITINLITKIIININQKDQNFGVYLISFEKDLGKLIFFYRLNKQSRFN